MRRASRSRGRQQQSPRRVHGRAARRVPVRLIGATDRRQPRARGLVTSADRSQRPTRHRRARAHGTKRVPAGCRDDATVGAAECSSAQSAAGSERPRARSRGDDRRRIAHQARGVEGGQGCRIMIGSRDYRVGPVAASPPGQYLLQWEQRHLDQAVADLFGFHALQLGLPAARSACAPTACRIAGSPRRDGYQRRIVPTSGGGRRRHSGLPLRAGAALHCDFDALPFPSHSLDLVVLPHALELARDPHLALREVERVLVPEGRVDDRRLQPGEPVGPAPAPGPRAPRRRPRAAAASCSCRTPASSSATGACATGCVCSASRSKAAASAATARRCTSARWLARSAWMERVGERWWPVFGAVYYVVAVKRVRGMRLVGLARPRACASPRRAGAVVRQRRQTLSKPRRRANEATVVIYTDGACKGNPGPGGWGAWLQLRRAREGVVRRRGADHQQPHGADRA